jgi:hypothetical protein
MKNICTDKYLVFMYLYKTRTDYFKINKSYTFLRAAGLG